MVGAALLSVYFINSLAGNIYVHYKGAHFTPFSSIEKQLRYHIPDDANVSSYLYFWTGLSHTNMTLFTGVDWTDSDVLGHYEYIVLSSRFKDRVSSVTLQTNHHYSSVTDATMRYHHSMRFIGDHAVMVHTIPTVGYGDIQIWKPISQ